MKQRWNGSVQSSNVPSYGKVGISRDDFGLYRCMITKVLYVDDPGNISKNSQNPEVLYEVIILGGFASGQILSYCRLASWLGGNDNYSERTLTPTSKSISKDSLSKHDGDVVFVQFVQGHDSYPIIIATSKGLSNNKAAKKADGPRFLEQFNGVQTEIDNKGQIHRTMFGGTTDSGRFTPGKSSVIKEEWLKDELLTRKFKTGLTITEDGKNDKVSIKTAGGPEVVVDGKGKKATFTIGSSEVTIDGTGNKISIKAGSTEILVDGGSGKISLKGEMIDLGSSVADFVTQFTQLATAFATHTHIGNLGAPTSPPNAPLLTTVGSQTVKVQA